MKGKIKTTLLYLLQPRTIIFFVALFNFVWFFSKFRVVVEFGSTSISFCYICAWYWDWSLTNLPSLSLLAATCLLFSRWKGLLAACLISGYQVIDGIIFVSDASGFRSGFSQRLDIIANLDNEFTNFWDLLDIQYLLALIIFIIASAYLVRSIVGTKQTVISYP